jgi:hypothetical protein
MAVVIVMPAVFFMPVTIGAAGYILPVGSVAFAYVIAQDETDTGKCVPLRVPIVQDPKPPWRSRNGHTAALPSPSPLILPAHAFAIASALLLPGGASSLLPLLCPCILPCSFL